MSALVLAGGSILLPSPAGADCTLSGAGTAASPYLIGSYSDLKQLSATFGCDLSKTYLLTADIDASASKGENGAWGFAPIGDSVGGQFTGVFHGARHVISHLYIVDSSKAGQVTSKGVGLFDYLSGKVDHLELADAHIEGRSLDHNVGSIAGYLNGSIDSCIISRGYVGLSLNQVNLSPNYSSGCIGGLVGYPSGGRIRFCQTSDSVIGPDNGWVGGITGLAGADVRLCRSSGLVRGGAKAYVGGIAGGSSGISYSTIDSSYASGTLIGGNSAFVGGIVGHQSAYGVVSRSYANIQASGGKGSAVGGIVGYSNSSVYNCYALGSVSAEDSSMIGGLAGDWESANPIRTCYSLVNVGGTSASTRGQISGYAPSVEAIHWYSYWNTKNEGPSVSIGKLKVATDTVTAFGLSDSQMQVQSSFYAFSFATDSAWLMLPNSYPVLRGMANATAPGFTGISARSMAITNGPSLQWVGRVAKLELLEAAQVRLVDLQGRVALPESRFAAGTHDLALPKSHTIIFAQVRTGSMTKTLPLSPVN